MSGNRIPVDGNTEVLLATAVSNMAAPTAAECNAALRIANDLTEDGLNIEPKQATYSTSSLGSTAETEDLGRRSLDGGTLTFLDSTGGEVWAALASNPVMYLIVRTAVSRATTFAAAQKVQIYKVKIGARNITKTAKNAPKTFTVPCVNQADFVDEVAVAA